MTIANVLVVGSGTLGNGIAQVCASAISLSASVCSITGLAP